MRKREWKEPRHYPDGYGEYMHGPVILGLIVLTGILVVGFIKWIFKI